MDHKSLKSSIIALHGRETAEKVHQFEQTHSQKAHDVINPKEFIKISMDHKTLISSIRTLHGREMAQKVHQFE